MVKTTKSVLSETASGKLASALIFSMSKKGGIVKAYATPANPRSPKQLAVRAMQGWIGQQWKLLSTADRDTWLPKSLQAHVHPYHAYLGENGARWPSFLTPTKAIPPSTTPPAPNYANMSAWPTYRTANFNILAPTGEMAWGVILHRSLTSGFTANWDNAVLVVLQDVAANVEAQDKDLEPGVYYYRPTAFGRGGLHIHPGPQRTVTIT